MSLNLHDVPVVIVGAGQAGLCTSYYLTQSKVPHVVLERGQIANAWKTQRWDSFALNTPNWMLNLPGMKHKGVDPDAFMLRDEFTAHLESWAQSFNAPVRCEVNVERLSPHTNGFRLETNQGSLTAQAVVVATATYMQPKVPALAQHLPKTVQQLRIGEYGNPSDVAPGAVLVVGSGETGCQIVEDLLRANRNVYLCVGRAARLPRRYRGRDIMKWQRDLGVLDRTPDMLQNPKERFAATPQLTGRDGGSNVSLHDFRQRGVTLLGRLQSVENTRVYFGDNLLTDIAYGDDFVNKLRTDIDAYISANNIEAPPPTADELAGEPSHSTPPPELIPNLDLAEHGINTVIWTTGFNWDFSWIEHPILDDDGYPVTNAGATSVPGLYFCGLNWMVKRKSGILYGVAEDAERVARGVYNHIKKITK